MTTHNNPERTELQLNAVSTTKQLTASPSTTDFALQYRNAGLSVIPVGRESKKPKLSTWEPYQSTTPTENELRSWWSSQSHSIAIVCGAVSNNLEVLDFDEKYNADAAGIFDRWHNTVELARPGLVDRLVTQKTMNNGYHIIYRCSQFDGNLVLAEREATASELVKNKNAGAKTLIETRGEGGYCLCFPSTGYAVINGDLTAIPEITPEERDILFAAARAMNTHFKSTSIVGRLKGAITGTRPGDVFNVDGDHKALLEKHGWVCVGDKYENEQWMRPGKTNGLSATYHKEKKCLYVFSSNAGPFENGKAYTNFGVFALLEAGGDFTEAARLLAAQGYGEAPSSKQGSSRQLIEEAEAFVRSHCDLRRNLVTGRVEIKGTSQTDYLIMGDYELNSLHGLLLKADIGIGYEMLGRHLNSDFVDGYDPFVAYYDSLPAWDGVTDYIEELAATVTLVDPNENKQFQNDLERWLIGYVATAIQADAVNQAAIIFTGGQGIGKSRWLNKLVPSSLSNYQFTGTIHPGEKDSEIYLAECMLINLDEFESLRKSEIGELKSAMTKHVVTVRRPYGRFPETMTRRASFVGSINKKDFLNDETGSRRFLTYEVQAFKFAAIPDIDLVLAQAYKRYKDGKAWWFTEAEIAVINTRNMKYSQMSYEEELLLDTVYKGTTYWYTSTKIAEEIKKHYLDFRVDAASVKNIGYALNKNGYNSKRGSKGWKYNVDIRPMMAGA